MLNLKKAELGMAYMFAAGKIFLVFCAAAAISLSIFAAVCQMFVL